LPSIDVYKEHLTAPFHVYNVNRKMAKLDPISEELFNSKKNSKLMIVLKY